MSKELDQHDAAAWSQRQRQRTPRKPAAPANQILDECSAHLAREYHAQAARLGDRLGILAAYSWDDLSPDQQRLAVVTMRSLLYRGVIVCTKIEHRIKFSLRERV